MHSGSEEDGSGGEGHTKKDGKSHHSGEGHFKRDGKSRHGQHDDGDGATTVGVISPGGEGHVNKDGKSTGVETDLALYRKQVHTMVPSGILESARNACIELWEDVCNTR